MLNTYFYQNLSNISLDCWKFVLKTLRRQGISTLCSLRTEEACKNLQNIITHSIFNIETSNKTWIIENWFTLHTNEWTPLNFCFMLTLTIINKNWLIILLTSRQSQLIHESYQVFLCLKKWSLGSARVVWKRDDFPDSWRSYNRPQLIHESYASLFMS